jgi:hypothetical protein
MTRRVSFSTISLVLIVLFVIMLAGCARLKEEATFISENAGDEAVSDEDTETATGTAVTPNPEAIPPKVPVQNKTVKTESANKTLNKTMMEQFEAEVSGSLSLQSDLELCPHLKRKFSCSQYALKLCDREQFGFAQFVPDGVTCSASTASTNEICLLRKCGPISDEGNIVIGYGGVFARAEYSHVKRIDQGNVYHDYKLLSCGEMKKEFSTESQCVYWTY